MKIINDILKVNSKYSLKRVVIAVTLCFTLLIGSSIACVDFILAREVSEKTYSVFASMLLFLTSIITVNEAGKKIKDREPKTEEDCDE